MKVAGDRLPSPRGPVVILRRGGRAFHLSVQDGGAHQLTSPALTFGSPVSAFIA